MVNMDEDDRTKQWQIGKARAENGKKNRRNILTMSMKHECERKTIYCFKIYWFGASEIIVQVEQGIQAGDEEESFSISGSISIGNRTTFTMPTV